MDKPIIYPSLFPVPVDTGQWAGFLALREQDGYIDQLFIDSQFQHRGIGTALMNEAKQRSPEGLTLDTLQQNQVARAFYERHSFSVVDVGINARNGQPNITYRWKPGT